MCPAMFAILLSAKREFDLHNLCYLLVPLFEFSFANGFAQQYLLAFWSIR